MNFINNKPNTRYILSFSILCNSRNTEDTYRKFRFIPLPKAAEYMNAFWFELNQRIWEIKNKLEKILIRIRESLVHNRNYFHGSPKPQNYEFFYRA